jgi:hypothetical protein
VGNPIDPRRVITLLLCGSKLEITRFRPTIA